MADFTTYDAVGNREDIGDMINMLDLSATPFLSAIARNKATATLHEWQTDKLATPGNNARIEGASASDTTIVPTVKLTNQTQISDKVPSVSRTQRQIDSAGRSDEMTYQLLKMGKELKNDQEFALLANNAKVTGDGSTTARELAGVPTWIADNLSMGGSGVAPSGDGTDTVTEGTPRVLTEDLVKGVLAQIYNEGGNPDLILAGSFNKQKFSSFVGGGASGPAQRTVTGDAKSVTAAVDVYVSDFGSLKIVPARHIDQSMLYILQTDMWKLSELSPIKSTPLAKTGDFDRELLNTEYTLEACNPLSSGLITGLTTA